MDRFNSVEQQTQNTFDALDSCCQKVIEKMGVKPISDWRVDDYNRLSSQLGKKTKAYLSENTLKRIFGRLKTHQRYYPQKSTRDALAQFIGHRDWQEFELIHSLLLAEDRQSTAPQNIKTALAEVKYTRKYKWNKLAIASSVGILFLLVGILVWNRGEKPMDVELVCVNPIGNIPHSATFKLKFNGSFDQDEKFQIEFKEEGMSSTISGKKEVVKFFKNPEVVYATLLYKGKPIDTVSVFMKTKGWVANSSNDTSRSFPVLGFKTLNPKNISVSAQQLDSAGLETSKPFTIGYSNIKLSNISGDNFYFTCRIFSEISRPGTSCVGTALLIKGAKDMHVINLFRKNCSAFCDYKFSEVRVLGSDKNLQALAFDPENGGDIAIEVKNKAVSIFLNGKLALTTKYTKPIGKVMGLKILFNGIGKAISPKLIDLSTGEVF